MREIELVDQNSGKELCSSSSHKELLDLWAHLPSFEPSYNEEIALREECSLLRGQQLSAKQILLRSESDLTEIEEAPWKGPEEEAELDAEHKQLVTSSKLALQLSEMQQELGSMAIATRLKRLANRCSVHEAAELLKSAAIEVEEAEKIVDQTLFLSEVDPRRIEQIEERIGILERLKRRFGDVEKTKTDLKKRIQELENLDDQLVNAEKRFAEVALRNQIEAADRSKKRREAADELSLQLTDELSSLNLQNARFEVRIEKKELGPDGADTIHFFFSANAGEPLRPLEECASGGEQSRLLFAFKTLFAQKEKRSCIIFDEIDSNVGGQTAAILGQKLSTLARLRQVVSITHFVQVAKQADDHFLVSKSSEEGKTKTCIQKLGQEGRRMEYARMIGK